MNQLSRNTQNNFIIKNSLIATIDDLSKITTEYTKKYSSSIHIVDKMYIIIQWYSETFDFNMFKDD